MNAKLLTLTLLGIAMSVVSCHGAVAAEERELTNRISQYRQLLKLPEVAREIGMTAEQERALADIMLRQRSGLRSAIENGRAVPPQERREGRKQYLRVKQQLLDEFRESFSPKQLDRLKRLVWQAEDTESIFDSEVAAALKVTETQQAKMNEGRVV